MSALGLHTSAVLIEGAVNPLRSLTAFGVTLLDICTSHPWEHLSVGAANVHEEERNTALQACGKQHELGQ